MAAANDYNEKWNTHFSHNRTNKVCLTENKVFAIANNHLYTVTKEDGVLDKYTKIDEIPFDSTRKRMTTVHGDIAFCKGAANKKIKISHQTFCPKKPKKQKKRQEHFLQPPCQSSFFVVYF